MAPPKEHDLNCLTIAELERLAADLLSREVRNYYNEGSDSNSTLRENQHAYNKYRIRARVLRDVSRVDTSKELFGFRSSVPFGVAPTAMQRLAHSDGELGTARACQAAGVPMGLSSFATHSLEEVAQSKGDTFLVLQLYLLEEKEHSRKLIQRAKKAGYKAVFLTVDTPFIGRRNSEIRDQFKLPPHLDIANFPIEETIPTSPDGENGSKQAPRPKMQRSASSKGYTDDNNKRVLPQGPVTFHTHAPNPTLTWEEDIEWLKKECLPEMQVWLKGIATAEDAILALHHDVSGIVVSNHGGRQLDGALATIDALPEVVEAIGGRIPVHVDGGIREGKHIFTALALGADFCWVGRPALWGLAYQGAAGVELMLKLLRDEFHLCMALAGTVKVEDITKDYLMKVDSSGFVSRL